MYRRRDYLCRRARDVYLYTHFHLLRSTCIIRGQGYQADIAVDDITLRVGACPTDPCETTDHVCGVQCVAERYICDGTLDCQDYSDEVDCPCNSDQWQCGEFLAHDMYILYNTVEKLQVLVQ